jgi:very-short-patch-repair endonuclease
MAINWNLRLGFNRKCENPECTNIVNKQNKSCCSYSCSSKVKGLNEKLCLIKSEKMKGQNTGPKSEEMKSKLSLVRKGKTFDEIFGVEKSKIYRENHKQRMLKRWDDLEFRKKYLGKRKMSSLEVRMNEIIQKYNLPYKFVGNGDYRIGRKIPDFINESKKIAIEVFCRTHKDMFRGGWQQWMNDRKQYFEKLGWNVLFFDPIDLQDDQKILGAINEF